MIEKEFRADALYNKIVHFYMDKKGYSKKDANRIAQSVITKEIERRRCKNSMCRHQSHDHIRNTGVCLSINCVCTRFVN